MQHVSFWQTCDGNIAPRNTLTTTTWTMPGRQSWHHCNDPHDATWVRGSDGTSKKCPCDSHDNLGGRWCGACLHSCMGHMRQLEWRWTERNKAEGVMGLWQAAGDGQFTFSYVTYYSAFLYYSMILGLFTVAIFRPFSAHFQFHFSSIFQKWTSEWVENKPKNDHFWKIKPFPRFCKDGHFHFHFHFPFFSFFQTLLWHPSTTMSPYLNTSHPPPAVTTPTPTPTSTNATNHRKPTTSGPNDDGGCLGPR